MKIKFVATVQKQGEVVLFEEELDKAREEGVDVADRRAVADWFREYLSNDGILDEVITDETSSEDLELVEWIAE